ncbi:hypothetical protein [Cognatilysobacter bugurensis]|uniref:Uncharacterized protein n=1 Tax=Cognatilysobacter bugurensis TaxID=543356 RepID=A0A918WA30_9GAMM|nr:hypothetical protein [Lysobacter bugurensis]GHA87405.1 hypothetical protein GCM10007067_26670 [Lysobacter bugurensis]
MTIRFDIDWPGWSDEQTLVLPIPVDAWAPPHAPIALDGIEFEPRDELHVTLAGRALGRQLHASLGERFRNCAVRAAFEAQDWRLERTHELLRLRKVVRYKSGEERISHALIEQVRMPAMARFHQALGDLLGRKLPVPPPHVTLYTHGRIRGIGVPSPAKLRAWTVRAVDSRELEAAVPMMS